MIGGYRSNVFETKPSVKFECPLCFEILKDPLQCSSGHAFCKTCISTALNRKGGCPICKVSLDLASMSRSLFVQQFIEELTTVCVSHDCETTTATGKSECTWKGPLHTRDHHYERNCDYFVIKCENEGCEEKMFRKSISEHNESCIFAVAKCEHCVSEHTEASCWSSPSVLCSRVCCASLSFDQVEVHPMQIDSINTSLQSVSLNEHSEQNESTLPKASKSSKKNAKKAAKRKNQTTESTPEAVDALLIIQETSFGNRELRHLTSEFMSTMPRVMAAVKVMCNDDATAHDKQSAHQKFDNLTERYFSVSTALIANASYFDTHIDWSVVFVLHVNSVKNLILTSKNRHIATKAAAHFIKYFVRFHGFPFILWLRTVCAHAVNEDDEVMAIVFNMVVGDKQCAIVNSFNARHQYQLSVEVTVSGSGFATINGKYRYDPHKDNFKHTTTTTPTKCNSHTISAPCNCAGYSIAPTITLTKTLRATLWYVCFSNGVRLETLYYVQIADSTDEAVPSETKPWLRTKYSVENEEISGELTICLNTI